MNANRRKQINEIVSEIEEMHERLQVICEDANGILTDEDEYLANVPEELYRSKMYQTAREEFCSLSRAYDGLQDAVETLQAAVADFAEATQGGQK